MRAALVAPRVDERDGEQRRRADRLACRERRGALLRAEQPEHDRRERDEQRGGGSREPAVLAVLPQHS